MILTRYLSKEIFKSQIAILFILLLLFFAQQFVRVLGSAVKGSIPADVVTSLLVYGMPSMGQLMLPLSLYVALLLTLGRLYAESEITVMRACGVGRSMLIKVALLLSLFTTALAAYNAFWLSPWAISQQISVVEQAKANPRLSSIAQGQFISGDNGDFVLFVDKVKNKELNDIYLFQTKAKGNNKPSVVVAKSGTLEALPNGDQILKLNSSERYEGDATLPNFTITQFNKYQVYYGFTDVNITSDDVERLTPSQLIKNGSPKAIAELNWRICLVLIVPIMALFALPLSKVNPRQGRFAKLLPAMLLYLIYFLLQSSLKSSASGTVMESTIFMQGTNIIFIIGAIFANTLGSTWLTRLMANFSFKSKQAVAK